MLTDGIRSLLTYSVHNVEVTLAWTLIALFASLVLLFVAGFIQHAIDIRRCDKLIRSRR